MDIEITTGSASSGDQLRSLRSWLLDEPEFRGRVAMREASPRPGEMGPAVDALVLPLAGVGVAFGAASVRTLGNVVIAWLRARTSPVDVTVRRADGAEVTLSVADVRRLSSDGVARLLDQLTERIGSVPAGENAGGSDADEPEADEFDVGEFDAGSDADGSDADAADAGRSNNRRSGTGRSSAGGRPGAGRPAPPPG